MSEVSKNTESELMRFVPVRLCSAATGRGFAPGSSQSGNQSLRSKSFSLRFSARTSPPRRSRRRSRRIASSILRFGAVGVFLYCLLLCGCSQKMGSQPTSRPLEQSDFFKDGQEARNPPLGTVPRRYQKANSFPGSAGSGFQEMASTSSGQNPDNPMTNTASAQTATAGNANADTFPLPVTAELLARGHERYDIYCSVCHGLAGYGDGMIVQRGYSHPPSFHTDTLRGYPVSHFFDVISKGFGAMPSYGVQVPPKDRWAIIAYIRALQLSQHATLAEVPQEDRQKLDAGGQQQ